MAKPGCSAALLLLGFLSASSVSAGEFSHHRLTSHHGHGCLGTFAPEDDFILEYL